MLTRAELDFGSAMVNLERVYERESLVSLGPLAGVAACFLCAGTLLAARFPADSDPQDPVTFRFCTVGDSRADPDDPELPLQDKVWLQNTKVLSRLIREILEPHTPTIARVVP